MFTPPHTKDDFDALTERQKFIFLAAMNLHEYVTEEIKDRMIDQESTNECSEVLIAMLTETLAGTKEDLAKTAEARKAPNWCEDCQTVHTDGLTSFVDILASVFGGVQPEAAQQVKDTIRRQGI